MRCIFLNVINIGQKCGVSKDKIIAIFEAGSAPTKRVVTDAKNNGKLLDATHGQRTRSVIFTSDYVILSMISVDTLIGRIEES